MFTKEERLFIWEKVYEMIDRLEDGEYICVALRNVVFMYFKTHKNIYEFRSNVRNPRFYNRWNHPHFPTRKCPSEVARQGKYNV